MSVWPRSLVNETVHPSAKCLWDRRSKGGSRHGVGGAGGLCPPFYPTDTGRGGGCFLPRMKYLGSSLPATIGDDHKQVNSN